MKETRKEESERARGGEVDERGMKETNGGKQEVEDDRNERGKIELKEEREQS